MSREELKARVAAEIERHKDEIIAIGERIWGQPELGFKEFRTAQVVMEEFGRLDLPQRSGLAITGVKAIRRGRPAGTDCGDHRRTRLDPRRRPPFRRPDNRARHTAAATTPSWRICSARGSAGGVGRLAELSGRVALFAVPAEEYVEIEYRSELRRQGKIELLGGKSELVRLGEFDDIDMAMMVHTASKDYMEGVFGSSESSNGFVGKNARFTGKAAHAAGAPHRGVNALYAATVALDAINAQRETYRDEDAVRIHPIISRGGDLVNVIPNDVRMETYVRGKTVEAIEAASAKVDRALKAGALALGAKVDITTLPGYLPLFNDPQLLRTVQGEFRAGLRSVAVDLARPWCGLDRYGRHRPPDARAAPVCGWLGWPGARQ